MTVTLSPAARNDIAEAAEWYEDRRAGLGEDFLGAVVEALQEIEEFPRAAPEVHRQARRSILRRFPYFLLYRLEDRDGGEAAIIIGCFHAKRDPAHWEARR